MATLAFQTESSTRPDITVKRSGVVYNLCRMGASSAPDNHPQDLSRAYVPVEPDAPACRCVRTGNCHLESSIAAAAQRRAAQIKD